MSEIFDFTLMVVVPFMLTVALSVWLAASSRKRGWRWFAILPAAALATLLVVGLGDYGLLWVFRIGPAGTDLNGFNIGGALFLYGFFLPLSVAVSVIAILAQKLVRR